MSMAQRILGILSWVGVVLVFGALVVRFTKPEYQTNHTLYMITSDDRST